MARITDEEAARRARFIEAAERAKRTRASEADAAKVTSRPAGQKIKVTFSSVATDGTCPKCGGATFKAKRSFGGKVAGGILAPKTRVRCVTCGTEYRRG